MDVTPVFSDEELHRISCEFDRLSSLTYLDHTGSCLYSKSLIEAIYQDLSSSTYSNPHSNSTCSETTGELIDQVRLRILQHFNTDQNEYCVVFTSGATGSLKLVAESFAWTVTDEDGETEWHPKASDPKNNEKGYFVYFNDSHTSVLGMRTIIEEKGVSTKCLTIDEAFSTFNSSSNVTTNQNHEEDICANSLFVYPAQCNFSGFKYPLEWIQRTHDGSLNALFNGKRSNWYCYLDAATYLSSSPLDLNKFKPDFICLSFYKIFGYPTGLGALIVKNSSANVLMKKYYGGGTVHIALSSKNCFVPRPILHGKFEDGTLNFLSIISLQHCFKTMDRLVGNMNRVSRHCFLLAKYAFESLLVLHHSNGSPVVELYSDTCYDDETYQGGIISFNLLRPSGEYVGFIEVLHQANLHKIQLRVGCFCNLGACWRHLNLFPEEVKAHYKAGHVCGDNMDLVNGRPTGAIRISFGYYTNFSHVDLFLDMIKKCYVQQPLIKKIPEYWVDKSLAIKGRLKTKGTSLRKDEIIMSSLNQGMNLNRNDKSSEKFLEHPSQSILKITEEPTLSNIFVYPIKSCGAISATTWKLDSRGLVYDRMWMIINSSGVALTQKKEPKMCLIKPHIDFKDKKLILNFEGKTFSTALDDEEELKEWKGSVCHSKVCGDRIEGFDCGDGVAAWLSEMLDISGLRLIRQHSRTSKISSLSLANVGQYLLVSKTSVLWLSNQIDSPEFNKETFIDRFRSNLVVENIPEPFVELNWTKVNIGDCEFKVDGSCSRCHMICIDQNTGETNREPLTTLGAAMKGKLKFGIYLSHKNLDSISLTVGSKITFV